MWHMAVIPDYIHSGRTKGSPCSTSSYYIGRLVLAGKAIAFGACTNVACFTFDNLQEVILRMHIFLDEP